MDGAVFEIYGIESLFLGKKTYTDFLEPTGKYGNTINSEHIGRRGIQTPCIKYKASQDNITVLYIYILYVYIYI